MAGTTKKYNPNKWQVICRVSEIEARLNLARIYKALWIAGGLLYATGMLWFMVWCLYHW